MDSDKASWLFPPRVVILISTKDKEGNANLAPFSEFVRMYSGQFLMCIERSHHTYKNIMETKEFVVALPTINLAKEIAITGKSFPKEVSEFEKSGLTPIAATKVKPSLVKECIANFECTLDRELGVCENEAVLVGNIVATHFEEEEVSTEAETRLSSNVALHVSKGRIYTSITGKTVDTEVDVKDLS